MEVLQNIHAIVAVAVLVLLDIVAVIKAVSVIVKKARDVQEASEEEKAAAKEAIKGNLLKIIISLVTDAEKELGGGTGRLKSSKVAGWIYDKIPDELKPLFSADEIQDMIDDAVKIAQEIWDKNSKAREYIESGAAVAQVLNATFEGSPAPGVDYEQIAGGLAEAIQNAFQSPQSAGTVQEVKEPTPGQDAAERPPDADTEAENAAPIE